jgi:hypothetical protein
VIILYYNCYDASSLKIFLFMYTAGMANTYPKRTLRKSETWLGDYEGSLKSLLRGMLHDLGCETKISIIKCIYYDGDVVAKCRVGVQLLKEIGMSIIMPYGKEKTLTTAYHMAIFSAITELIEYKTTDFLCF